MARGYSYLLALYFSLTRIPSQLSAAVPGCCAGALTAVLGYRMAHGLFSRRVAIRTGWWTCLFPLMIIWSAQTIKEPFVVLFESGALYGCLQLRISRFSIRHVLLCGLSVIVLVTMRFYAAYVTGAVILLTLALPHFGRRKLAVGAMIGVATIALPLLSYSGALDRHRDLAESWDLDRTETYRRGMARTAQSGVETHYDLHTNRGLGLVMGVGAVHLLLAPFPWQLGVGSLRMLLTAPEMLVWWYLFFAGVLPGLWHSSRHRFGDVLPLLLFLLGLGLIYSLTFGNVGTAYRQRGQLMPILLALAMLGLERREPRRAARQRPRQRPVGGSTDRAPAPSLGRFVPRGPEGPIATTCGDARPARPRGTDGRRPQASGSG
jgi:hypothetical protein